MDIKRIIFFIAVAGLFTPAEAQTQKEDTIKDSRLRRYWNSLVHGNIDRTFERKMDMSFIVSPCYTREGSFGIGGAATGLYRIDRTDSVMQPSDISLSGSATVNGFYSITVKGNNHFRGNKRLSCWSRAERELYSGFTYDAARVLGRAANGIFLYWHRFVCAI